MLNLGFNETDIYFSDNRFLFFINPIEDMYIIQVDVLGKNIQFLSLEGNELISISIIKYVYRLQNLWFKLTDVELKTITQI